jgi:hypothetical protein
MHRILIASVIAMLIPVSTLADEPAAAKSTFESKLLHVRFDYPAGWEHLEKKLNSPVTPIALKVVAPSAPDDGLGALSLKVMNAPQASNDAASLKVLVAALEKTPGAKIIESTDTKLGKVAARRIVLQLGENQLEETVAVNAGKAYVFTFAGPTNLVASAKPFVEPVLNSFVWID